MMRIQIISREGRKVCTTLVPYDPETIKQMKRAGYKVKEIIRDDLRPAAERSALNG